MEKRVPVSQAKGPDAAPSAEEIAELYRAYLPRILNYIRLRVDGQSLAEDLTAAVFERALTRQHTLRKWEAFGAWLFRIAHTLSLIHISEPTRLLSSSYAVF